MKKRKKKSVAIESNQSSSLPRACFLGQRAKQKVLFSTIKKKTLFELVAMHLPMQRWCQRKVPQHAFRTADPRTSLSPQRSRKKKKTAFLMS